MVSLREVWASLRRPLAPAVLLLAARAWALPVVSVAPEWPNAHESGPTPGIYLFTRTGDVSQPLTVDYTLSGSAAQDTDYLVWEPAASFAAGSATARVAILPVNDALQEGPETATLTITPGAAYTVGTPASADITIGDAYSAGRPGVWDTSDTDPSGGRPLVPADIGYLDAWVQDGALYMQLWMARAPAFGMYDLYINVDQNAESGDYRQGHVAGPEYRVSLDADLTQKWYLYQLPTFPPLDGSPEGTPESLTGQGQLVAGDDGSLLLGIPVTMLRNRQRFDVYAVTVDDLNVTTPGVGDRCPDYGAFSTFTRRVEVRHPGVTQHVTLPDPAGDAQNGFDLTGVSVTTVADQFTIALAFTEGFDPSDSQYHSGPSGAVTVDGDRSLFTGDFGLGGPIPTFGGDSLLVYSIGSVMMPASFCYIQTDTDRSKVYFGGDGNDASWLAYAPYKTLYLRGSLSLLSPFTKTVADAGTLPQRVLADGPMRAQAESWWNLDVADAAPPGGAAFDSVLGTVLPPYQWDAARTVSQDDPLDLGGLSGMDWTHVDAEVVDNSLVVKGTLAGWINTDYGNRLEVLLDTDMDAGTGTSVNNPESGGAPIGVDAVFAVHSVRMAQDASVGYFGIYTPTGGESTRHDAAIGVRVNSAFGVPGWFVATIPLDVLQPSGQSLRLYIRSGYFLGPSGDTAPPNPMVVSLAAGFTLADARDALRMAAGLIPGATRLNVDAGAGVTVSDAVHIARKAAGLEANP